MGKFGQVFWNVVLYAFLLWLMYDATIASWDPWFAFTVGFVLVLAVAISIIPALHAPRVSPGEYPFDD